MYNKQNTLKSNNYSYSNYAVYMNDSISIFLPYHEIPNTGFLRKQP